MMVWKMIFLFQGCILRFHVNLRGCTNGCKQNNREQTSETSRSYHRVGTFVINPRYLPPFHDIFHVVGLFPWQVRCVYKYFFKRSIHKSYGESELNYRLHQLFPVKAASCFQTKNVIQTIFTQKKIPKNQPEICWGKILKKTTPTS